MNIINRYDAIIAFSGIAFYVITFGLSFSVDYSLLMLAIISIFLTLTDTRDQDLKLFNLYIICFLTSIILSNFFGIDKSRSTSLTLTILPALLSYYLITNYLSRFYIRQLYILLSAFSLLISIYLITIAIHYPQENPSIWITKAQLTFLTAPNSITFIVLLSPLTIALFKSEKNSIKVLAIMSLFFTLALTIAYQSRSALLVMFVLMLTMSFFLTRLKTVFTILAILCGVTIFIDAMTGYGILTKIYSHSWTTRLSLWLAAYYMFLDAPLIGNGSGSYLLMYRQSLEHHQALYLLEERRLTPWAHNLYLEVLAEQGLIGFLLLLALLGYYLRKSWRTLTKSTQENRLLIICVFVALIGFCLDAIFELSLWQQWVLVLLFILFAIIDRLEMMIESA